MGQALLRDGWTLAVDARPRTRSLGLAADLPAAQPENARAGARRPVRLREGKSYLFTQLRAGPEGAATIFYDPTVVRMAFHLSDTAMTELIDRAAAPAILIPGDSTILSPRVYEVSSVAPFGSLRRLDILVQPADFVLLAHDLEARIPSGLLDALAGYGGGAPFHRSRMDKEMDSVVERIDHCPLSGSLRRIYVEGKVLELMALRLAQLAPAILTRRPRALTRHQVELLHEARAIVALRMESPPSLCSLSREVGMSTTVLKTGFRALFGETVFECLRKLRLDRAGEMLSAQGASAKEAAHAVGFASLSHFALAFRERFGVSPRVWAREHASRRRP